jgi:hypothetical protein
MWYSNHNNRENFVKKVQTVQIAIVKPGFLGTVVDFQEEFRMVVSNPHIVHQDPNAPFDSLIKKAKLIKIVV